MILKPSKRDTAHNIHEATAIGVFAAYLSFISLPANWLAAGTRRCSNSPARRASVSLPHPNTRGSHRDFVTLHGLARARVRTHQLVTLLLYLEKIAYTAAVHTPVDVTSSSSNEGGCTGTLVHTRLSFPLVVLSYTACERLRRDDRSIDDD